MNEKIDLKEFDIIGIISLKDVHGIEKYVTPKNPFEEDKEKEYFSRSKEYYNVKTLTELSLSREELKEQLTRECTKRNFVILENMMNCSGKVYFKKFENYIIDQNNPKTYKELEMARKCLIEDASNIVKLLEGKSMITVDPDLILPGGMQNSEKRMVEMDNKAMLYVFCKALEIDLDAKDVQVLTPGYGSIYIGPFLHAVHGYEFTNLFKSRYVQETFGFNNLDVSIRELVSNQKIFEPNKTVILLDDNIGTGKTMTEIKKDLEKEGIVNYLSGAIQFNWRNYYKVSVGEKLGIGRFNVREFDILSPMNYAGHKLFDHAVDTLHFSASAYENYLMSKSYRKGAFSDLEGALKRGMMCAQRTGLSLNNNLSYIDKDVTDEELERALEYNKDEDRTIRPFAKQFIKNMINNIQMIEHGRGKNDKEIDRIV